MPLTDLQIKNLKPESKPHKRADGKGLYILVKPIGKYWRFDYTFDGVSKTLSVGVYPEVSLSVARQRRDELRTMVANGINPSAHRKAVKHATAESASNSFEVVAREWFAKQSKK